MKAVVPAFVGAVSAASPALSVQVNVMGVVNVLEAARAFDVKRVVYQRQGRLRPGARRIRPSDLQPMPEDEESQTHLRLGQADGRERWHLPTPMPASRWWCSALRPPTVPARPRGMAPRCHQPDRRAMRGLPAAKRRTTSSTTRMTANGIYLATMAGKLKGRIFNIGTGVGATCATSRPSSGAIFPTR